VREKNIQAGRQAAIALLPTIKARLAAQVPLTQ